MDNITWNQVEKHLKDKELTKKERLFLLNYFNKEINSFPVDDDIKITPEGLILANGRVLSLEQRELFLTGAKSLKSNYAFNLIADQVMFQAIKVGLHEAKDIDQLYFTKSALYFIDLFKKWLNTLDKLA